MYLTTYNEAAGSHSLIVDLALSHIPTHLSEEMGWRITMSTIDWVGGDGSVL